QARSDKDIRDKGGDPQRVPAFLLYAVIRSSKRAVYHVSFASWRLSARCRGAGIAKMVRILLPPKSAIHPPEPAIRSCPISAPGKPPDTFDPSTPQNPLSRIAARIPVHGLCSPLTTSIMKKPIFLLLLTLLALRPLGAQRQLPPSLVPYAASWTPKFNTLFLRAGFDLSTDDDLARRMPVLQSSSTALTID